MDINIMFRSFPTISDNKMVSDRSRREYQVERRKGSANERRPSGNRPANRRQATGDRRGG